MNLQLQRAWRTVFVLLMLFVLLQAGEPLHADTIVDTGPGPGSLGGTVLATTQWLAGRFTTAQAYSITSVEGWLGSSVAGNIRITLYGGGGVIPDVTQVLYSGIFSASGLSPAWHGLHGLDWDISPGSYWASFEVPTGSTFLGFMPHQSSNPLADEAFRNEHETWLVIHDHRGLRVEGEPSSTPVPESSSFALLVIGLLAAFLAGRNKRSRPSPN